MFDFFVDNDVPWGGVHDPAPIAIDALSHLRQAGILRNYGDILFETPELDPFRSDENSPLDSLEAGDTAPNPRSFTRRLVGAIGEPLTLCSNQLDNLPLVYDSERSPPEWLAWLIRSGGLMVPDDTPEDALRAIMRRIDEIYPLGRFEGLVALAEAISGRAQRDVDVRTDGWIHTRLTFLDQSTLTISECWQESSLDLSVGNRMVYIASRGMEDWAIRLLERAGSGYFNSRIHRDEIEFGGEMLLGVPL